MRADNSTDLPQVLKKSSGTNPIVKTCKMNPEHLPVQNDHYDYETLKLMLCTVRALKLTNKNTKKNILPF